MKLPQRNENQKKLKLKEARIKELTQKNELIIERNDIKERLDEAEAHWASLKVDLNIMDTEWDRTKKDLQKTLKELREENSLLRDEMSNKDKEKKTEVQLKETKIKQFYIVMTPGFEQSP